MKLVFALILAPWLSVAATVKAPEASFYREFTNRIRKTGEFRVYMPDGKHQTVKYQFEFAQPVYPVPIVNDMVWNPPKKDFMRSFWDRVLFTDESFIEMGGEKLPLTCVFISGQDNRFSGQSTVLIPEFLMKIYLVANDYACQGPLKPGFPSQGGSREAWDTYLHFEVRDPTIMLPVETKIRYRWNEFRAVMIDRGQP